MSKKSGGGQKKAGGGQKKAGPKKYPQHNSTYIHQSTNYDGSFELLFQAYFGMQQNSHRKKKHPKSPPTCSVERAAFFSRNRGSLTFFLGDLWLQDLLRRWK